ncbi:MAG: Hsp20/alpha crystallin family protein [Candidatus Hydrogenedentes bacterium]|nr:Hsp20/alpha crystallin family protein [Candidatus Hydrogenedentota bacterium]
MEHFSRLFTRMYGVLSSLPNVSGLPPLDATQWMPLLDIYERDDTWVVVVELPGVERDQISVRVENQVLRISGLRPKRIPESTVHVHQMEIAYGPFVRTVALPEHCDVEHIGAEFRNGYLTITLPKGERR